jgi:hypothetical protein
VRAIVPALLLVATAAGDAAAQGQNPSPMVEHTRAHERLENTPLDGESLTIAGPGERHVEIFVPASVDTDSAITLVVHFHGAGWIAAQSVARVGHNTVSVAVNVGSGSTVYDRTFSDPAVFTALVRDVTDAVAAARGVDVTVGDISLTGFSAGHGAIRAILRHPPHFAAVGSVLLLDGMHTSYQPEGTVMAQGGTLDRRNLDVWADYARAAIAGDKRFIVTHSEIFPGTFASTTETADWLLAELGVERTAILEWGPRGLQQLSIASRGGFELLGYAGNSAPDHVDQFHAMPELLASLLR